MHRTVLLVLLYYCETLYLTIREEYKLKVLEEQDPKSSILILGGIRIRSGENFTMEKCIDFPVVLRLSG